MFNEWVIKIPVILIMGVATMLDSSKSILPSKALQHLSSFKFFLGSPAGRLDAIIESVLVKPCSGFLIGHKGGFIDHTIRQIRMLILRIKRNGF